MTASVPGPRIADAASLTPWEHQLAEWVRSACQMEVLSPKPGNVFPGHEFQNASVADFLRSADAIAAELATGQTRPLGETILKAVAATRLAVGHNTNLGIILLLAPLAAVPQHMSLPDGIKILLEATTLADSRDVYEAIRLAQPAGLGKVEDQDLEKPPTIVLRDCMQLASEWDLIAAQYANGFDQVLGCGMQWLSEAALLNLTQSEQVTWLAVRLMAEFGDSLIARKCGQKMSQIVQRKAVEILRQGWPTEPNSASALREFDCFLRADGNRRNPGTTADLTAAILFSGLRENRFMRDQSWPS